MREQEKICYTYSEPKGLIPQIEPNPNSCQYPLIINLVLFQGTKAEHPKGFCVSFMPNLEYRYINYFCKCCGGNDSDSSEEAVKLNLPEALTLSAKETVVKNLRLKEEQAEKNQLENRLENIESKMENIESKMDSIYQLLKK